MDTETRQAAPARLRIGDVVEMPWARAVVFAVTRSGSGSLAQCMEMGSGKRRRLVRSSP